MFNKITSFILLAVLFASSANILQSCSEAQMNRFEVTPMAYGKVDNIFLVADQYLWDQPIGDTFRMHFGTLYPVTPQPEPIFDVRHILGKEFNKVLKTHRTIILLADLNDLENPTTQLVRKSLGPDKIEKAKKDSRFRIAKQKDRWAKGQMVIYWFAPNRSELLKTVSNDYQQVIDIIHKSDAEKLLEEVYTRGESDTLNERMETIFDAELKIPDDYELAHQDSQALWVSLRTEKSINNILIYEIQDAGEEILQPDSLLAIRNRVTKKYFSTIVEDSYMQVDDKNLPVYYQQIEFGNTTGLQARGIWYMENDFMGGSFVTYLIPDPKNKRVIMLDGFVHAPGHKKRPEMRKLDTIFSTFKLKGTSNPPTENSSDQDT